MQYESLFCQAETIELNPVPMIPLGYDGPVNFIIPDSVIHHCIERYHLLHPGIKVLDPMCGIGSIPRVLNRAGGYCCGIEIDPERADIAAKLSPHISTDDLLKWIPLEGYDCIFTSMPFVWFKDPEQLPGADFAHKFQEALTPKGFILLDSVPAVIRDGNHWPVAERQALYLEKHGFQLTEIIKICHKDVIESVVMKFLQ